MLEQSNTKRVAVAGVLALAMTGAAGAAQAEVDPETSAAIDEIEARLEAQELRLAEQERRLAEQESLLTEQRRELAGLLAARELLLGDVRAGQDPAGGGAGDEPFRTAQADPSSELPSGPVGEAPPPPQVEERDVAALPERAGVLTPRGRFVVDPSIEYVRSSSNRLVFRGIEIVPGINIGLIEANEADRDTLVGNVGVRYGVTNRLEVELRGSYVYRKDRVMTVQQRDETLTASRELEGQDIGDLEFGLRYQLNSGEQGRPIFVANTRLKAPTGEGPFEVRYDADGVAQELATGSGFWGAEAGVSMLYPSDPGVIFGSLTYIYNHEEAVNRVIGGALVGDVDPGDGIGLSMGYGMSLNPRFSTSFGYSHTYIFPSSTEIGAITARSNEIHVGSMLTGWSFRMTPRVTISNNFEFGVTKDAPDMRWVLRVPVRF